MSGVLPFQPEGRPSYKAGLVIKKSVRFGFSGNVFISPLFLVDSFARSRILGGQLFSFCALNISACCPLISEVSDKKSALDLTGKNVMALIFLSALEILIMYLTVSDTTGHFLRVSWYP